MMSRGGVFALVVLTALAGRDACAQDAARTTPVAARDIARGASLVAADVRGTMDSNTVAPGWIARRAIRAGEMLRHPAVAPAPLVRRGTPIAAVLDHGALYLSLSAIALGDGHAGDRVAVRLGPNRILRGTVSGPARVALTDSPRLP